MATEKIPQRGSQANFKKPLILVVGASGRGKSTAIRNLDPETTVILNTEDKPLPFKGASKFTKQMVITDPLQLTTTFKLIKDKNEVEVVVLDSFSAWSDAMYQHARKTEKGWDVPNLYNTKTKELFDAAKSMNKFVFFLGHPEITNIADGSTVKSMKVKGKEWEGVTEKEATIVLYADMEADGAGQNRYFFRTQSDGITNAKSPMEMFDSYEIDNDFALVVQKVKEYYQ